MLGKENECDKRRSDSKRTKIHDVVQSNVHEMSMNDKFLLSIFFWIIAFYIAFTENFVNRLQFIEAKLHSCKLRVLMLNFFIIKRNIYSRNYFHCFYKTRLSKFLNPPSASFLPTWRIFSRENQNAGNKNVTSVTLNFDCDFCRGRQSTLNMCCYFQYLSQFPVFMTHASTIFCRFLSICDSQIWIRRNISTSSGISGEERCLMSF